MHHITLERDHDAHVNEEEGGFDDCHQAVVHCEDKDEARAVAKAVGEHVADAESDVATDAIARELIETMMGRALAVDDDPSEDRPRSFEHALRLLIPSEYTDHIEDAYEQATEGGVDDAESEGGEAA